MAKQKDWKLRTIYFCSAVAFAAALFLGLLLFLRSSSPASAYQLAAIPTLSEQYTAWPQELLIIVVLLLLTITLCLLARWRAMSNLELWPSAGCPACQDDSLVRVRRKRRDRVLALSGIPMARYLCLDCGWRGRRVRKGPDPKGNPTGLNDVAEAIYPGKQKMTSKTYFPRPETLQPEIPVDSPVGNGTEDPGTAQIEDLFSPQTILWDRTTGQANTIEDVQHGKQKETNDIGILVGTLPVKLRDRPIPGSKVLALLAPGTPVILLDDPGGEMIRSWQYVQVDELQGWIMAMFLERIYTAP